MIDHHHEHHEVTVQADQPLITFRQPAFSEATLLIAVTIFCAYQLWAYWKETKK